MASRFNWLLTAVARQANWFREGEDSKCVSNAGDLITGTKVPRRSYCTAGGGQRRTLRMLTSGSTPNSVDSDMRIRRSLRDLIGSSSCGRLSRARCPRWPSRSFLSLTSLHWKIGCSRIAIGGCVFCVKFTAFDSPTPISRWSLLGESCNSAVTGWNCLRPLRGW